MHDEQVTRHQPTSSCAYDSPLRAVRPAADSVNIADLLRERAEERGDAVAIVEASASRRSPLELDRLAASGRFAATVRLRGQRPRPVPMSPTVYRARGTVADRRDRDGRRPLLPAREHIDRCAGVPSARGFIAVPKAHVIRLLSRTVGRIPSRSRSTDSGRRAAAAWAHARNAGRCRAVHRRDARARHLHERQHGTAEGGRPYAWLPAGATSGARRDLELTAGTRPRDAPDLRPRNLASGSRAIIPDADLRRPVRLRPRRCSGQIPVRPTSRAWRRRRHSSIGSRGMRCRSRLRQPFRGDLHRRRPCLSRRAPPPACDGAAGASWSRSMDRRRPNRSRAVEWNGHQPGRRAAHGVRVVACWPGNRSRSIRAPRGRRSMGRPSRPPDCHRRSTAHSPSTPATVGEIVVAACTSCRAISVGPGDHEDQDSRRAMASGIVPATPAIGTSASGCGSSGAYRGAAPTAAASSTPSPSNARPWRSSACDARRPRRARGSRILALERMPNVPHQTIHLRAPLAVAWARLEPFVPWAASRSPAQREGRLSRPRAASRHARLTSVCAP